MRRSSVFIGLAVLLVAGAASAAYLTREDAKEQRIHQDVEVHNLALCEKTLEIAASIYSYTNKPAAETQNLQHWNAWYTNRLEHENRARMYELGVTETEYNALLATARLDAEKAIIPQINNADDPVAKVTEILPGCVEWPPRHALS